MCFVRVGVCASELHCSFVCVCAYVAHVYCAHVYVEMQEVTGLVCPSWISRKKNLNSFRTKAATHPGFAPLENSRQAVKNIPSVNSKTGG